jgi:adenine-specific DNA methylase
MTSTLRSLGPAAETWPARYRMHKYWGRKPANVVAEAIASHSAPGERVLDPFCGSGVTIVEAARLGRAAIGFDLSPFAVRLTRALLAPPDETAFRAAARVVAAEARRESGALFSTRCPRCAGDADARSTAWVGDEPRELRFRCVNCGLQGARALDDVDRARATARIVPPADGPDDAIFHGWEMRKLRRAGLTRWRELFTPRSFAAATALRRAALRVSDERTRRWLLLTLTAALAQLTRMISDASGAAGGPSWKLNAYWLPPRWQELHPVLYFENRAEKSARAIADLAAPMRPALCAVDDSRAMPLADASVDYIFTDPPYGGEGIQYAELSMLWCLWLGERESIAQEIAFNPVRGLSHDDYASGLRAAFRECARVLRPGRTMTVTFANKDAAVWTALRDACADAGFRLLRTEPLARSLPSLNETTTRAAPKEDLVLTYERPLRG